MISRISTRVRHRINFDHPDSLENELFLIQVDKLRAGESIEAPVYDFSTHRRLPETRRIEPKRVILLEGILVLAKAALRERIRIKLFVDTPPDIRFVRRLVRDIHDRGRTVESVIEQYITSVRPMHEEFVEPSKRFADLIIPEGGENAVAIDAIIAQVKHGLGIRD